MDIETNKVVVRRYIEMWNTGNIALADEILAPTYVDYAHPELDGPESVKRSLLAIREAFPDFHITIEFMIGEGDLVSLRGTIRRTQKGSEVVSHVLWLVRLIDGKMVELWTGSEVAG